MVRSLEHLLPSMDMSFPPCRKDFRHRVRTQPAFNTLPERTDRSFCTFCRGVRSFHLTTLSWTHPHHQEYPESPASARAGRSPFSAIEWRRESLLVPDCFYPCALLWRYL